MVEAAHAAAAKLGILDCTELNASTGAPSDSI
jgi:hypothetical protein